MSIGDIVILLGVAGLGVTVVGVGRLVGLERRHGNTVNHVEGVVVAVDRLVTTHHHLDTTTDTGSTGVDFDTCPLAWRDFIGNELPFDLPLWFQ